MSFSWNHLLNYSFHRKKKIKQESNSKKLYSAGFLNYKNVSKQENLVIYLCFT